MGPPSYMRSVVGRNVVVRRILYWCHNLKNKMTMCVWWEGGVGVAGKCRCYSPIIFHIQTHNPVFTFRLTWDVNRPGLSVCVCHTSHTVTVRQWD